jgi:hypothetical protein
MGIPIGRDHNVSLSGFDYRTVHCEECGEDYVYILDREGQGNSFNPMYLDSKGAEAEAQRKAEENLQHMLEEEIDPVPCPSCGHFQANMIPVARQVRHSWMTGLALIMMLAFAISIITALGAKQLSTQVIAAVVSGVCLVITVCALLLQKLLQQSYNPNHLPISQRLELARQRAASQAEQAESGLQRLELQLYEKQFEKALSVYRFNLKKRLIPAFMLLGLGLFFVYDSHNEAINGMASFWWAKAEGKLEILDITSNQSRDGKTTYYFLNVQYSFEVNKRTFSGNQHRLFPVISKNQDEIASLKSQLESQQTVISYSVSDPQMNVLVPGLTMPRIIRHSIGPLLCIFFGSMAWRIFLNLLRSRKELDAEWQAAVDC